MISRYRALIILVFLAKPIILTITAFFSRYYYCEGALWAITLVALAISLVRFNRYKQLNIFTWYILLSIIQGLTALAMHITTGKKELAQMIFGVFSCFFILAEYAIFVYFMLNCIHSVKRKRITKINAALFFLIILIAWARNPRFEYSPSLFSLESIFLILPCLLYFYELFTDIRMEPLKDQSSFWVVTGILFLNACSIPLFLSVGMLRNYFNVAFTLNYILYIIFFILLIRAYLCKPLPTVAR